MATCGKPIINEYSEVYGQQPPNFGPGIQKWAGVPQQQYVITNSGGAGPNWSPTNNAAPSKYGWGPSNFNAVSPHYVPHNLPLHRYGRGEMGRGIEAYGQPGCPMNWMFNLLSWIIFIYVLYWVYQRYFNKL